MKAATTCAIGERDGNVILEFPEAVQWAAFDPETARQIGEAIAKEAYHIHTGMKAEGKSILSDQVRNRLVTRATHIIRDLRLKGKSHGYIAMCVVDAILAEVS